MISDRLKGIIFKKLYSDLSRVEIIHYKTFIWFIDREDKCWYFRYDTSNGQLLWKYGFFSNFFTIFTMDSDEFTPVLSSWVEEVLNHEVTTTRSQAFRNTTEVEEVLNCRVTTTQPQVLDKVIAVEEVLNCRVTTTDIGIYSNLYMVEEVLNCKVNTTRYCCWNCFRKVEEVLNCKVNTTSSGDGVPLIWVEEVLNHNVGI